MCSQKRDTRMGSANRSLAGDRKGLPYHGNITSVVTVGYVQIVRSREGQPLPYNGVGRSFIRSRGDCANRSFSGGATPPSL